MMLLLSKRDRRGLPMAGEQQDLIKRAEDWLEAFNAGDWQRFAAGMTPDVVYEETGTQRRVDGVDAYVQLCQGWKQAFPDVRGAIRNVVASGDTVVQEIMWEGTHTGPLEGQVGRCPPPAGASMSRRHCGSPSAAIRPRKFITTWMFSPCLGS